jgi:hypothetical protein
MDLQKGSFIKLRAFGGKQIVRRFVRKHKGAVLICSNEEYRQASREHREPLCVGFPIDDVIGADARNTLRAANKRHSEDSSKRSRSRGKKRG